MWLRFGLEFVFELGLELMYVDFGFDDDDVENWIGYELRRCDSSLRRDRVDDRSSVDDFRRDVRCEMY